MSRMSTRIGPVLVTHVTLKNGSAVNVVTDEWDENLYMVSEGEDIVEALQWAIEYVQLRYPWTIIHESEKPNADSPI